MTDSHSLPDARSFARRVLPSRSGPGRVLRAVDRLETLSALDDVAGQLRRAVHALPLGSARDVLHGRWLGHPVHPIGAQVTIGAWLSSAVLDLLPGQRRASATLVGVGLLSAAPVALSGWVDWAETRSPQSRVGLVHAATNAAAICLYAGSLRARVRGRALRGRALGAAGLGVVAVGGALGGHLAYRQGVGANHTEHIPALVGSDWHSLGPVSAFPVGEPVSRLVQDVPVLVLRGTDAEDAAEAGEVHVLSERCSHLAGPLSQGTIADGCVQCPWHGSTFRLADGWNVTGPATAPLPVFDTRIVEGRLEARLRVS